LNKLNLTVDETNRFQQLAQSRFDGIGHIRAGPREGVG
jgi:hypothetical protein